MTAAAATRRSAQPGIERSLFPRLPRRRRFLGTLERGQGAGRLVVRRAERRAAERVGLETLGRLERGHRGGQGVGFRVHDLRHTAASVWLAAGADPKVVQRMPGNASAAMTMDLYGHLVDGNLWQAARIVEGISGASEPSGRHEPDDGEIEADESAW